MASPPSSLQQLTRLEIESYCNCGEGTESSTAPEGSGQAQEVRTGCKTALSSPAPQHPPPEAAAKLPNGRAGLRGLAAMNLYLSLLISLSTPVYFLLCCVLLEYKPEGKDQLVKNDL